MVGSTAKWAGPALQILWRVGLFFLVFGMFAGLVIAPLATVLSDWAEAFPGQAQVYADIAGALAMLAATWVMTRFVDRRPFWTIGFAPGSAGRDLSVGLALGAGWIVASVGAAWAVGWASPVAPAGFSGALVLVAAVSVLFNVLTQQLLLCGYIFQTLRSRAGFTVAVLVSAGLFSAYHAAVFQGAWLPALNVFAAGALFCLAYGVTGNLWLPLAIHFAWNFLLGPVLGLTVSGTGQMGLGWSLFALEGPALFTGGAFGLEGGLVVTLTTTFLIGALMCVRSRLPGGQPVGGEMEHESLKGP